MAGLTACAPAPTLNGASQAAVSDAETISNDMPLRSDLLARALGNAEEAAQAKDTRALASALLTIEGLDAKPQTSQDADSLAAWQALAANDAPATRGRTLGPAYRSGSVVAGGSAVIEQTFYGGTPASVSLQVPKGSALRLRIVDQSNRRVCDREAREAHCRWMPLFTQAHRIEIVNERADNAKYYIVFD